MLTFCVGLGQAPVLAQTTEPSEAAMTFVAGFSDDHLSGMLSRIGGRSEPMMALSQLGSEVVAVVFDAEIDNAVRKYSADWQRNLALSWTPLMTDEELGSLSTAGAQSPYTDKYLELRTQAGATMQSLSQDLFQKILGEVISNTVENLSPK
jgi:hypothetical protein